MLYPGKVSTNMLIFIIAICGSLSDISDFRSVFAWFGAVAPWASFAHNGVIPVYRLVLLGILILLLRRIPIIYAMHNQIRQIEHIRQNLFVGFFGPIGVSAVFYLHVSLEFLRETTVDGVVREDARKLEETITVVVWFLAICSIVSMLSPFSCLL